MRFLNRLEDECVLMHGFLFALDGKTLAEGYWDPFSAEKPHRVFSVSKSMTALALGILIGQNRVALSDKIAPYFPEFSKDPLPPQLERLTIRDMLRMTTCHATTTYKKITSENWASTFFAVPPTHKPGTVFSYDTSSSQTLAALVEKLTGMPLLSFLQESLFNKIGAIGLKRWLTDPSGTSQGGSGLLMTLRDMAKVALFCMGDGDGIVPTDFLHAATSKQADTYMRELPEERHGYGYQFWCTRDGFAMYGMGGQLAICVPRRKLALCTIADTQMDHYGTQRIHDAFFEEIVLCGTTPTEENAEVRKQLQARLDSLAIKPLPNNPQHALETNDFYQMMPNAMGWTALRLKSDALHLHDGEEWKRLPFGIGSMVKGEFPGGKEPCITSGGWYDRDCLCIQSHIIGDTPCQAVIRLVFTEDSVTMHANGVQDPITNRFYGITSGYRHHGCTRANEEKVAHS